MHQEVRSSDSPSWPEKTLTSYHDDWRLAGMLAQLNSRSRGYSVFKWLMVEPRERVWALPVLLAELWSGESGL